MREEFDQKQAEDYFRRLYEEKQKVFRNKWDHHQDFQNDLIYEDSMVYQTGTCRDFPRPMEVTPEKVRQLLESSTEYETVAINQDTFYVMDISWMKESPFNTLVFQLNQNPIVSKEYSNAIMSRYFAHIGFSYNSMCVMGKWLDIKKRCPYVFGEIIFIPEKGASQGKTSWFALHHVLHHEASASSLDTYIFCRNGHKVLLPIGVHSFRRQLEKSVNLYRAQHLLSNTLLAPFRLISQPMLTSEMNIVHNSLQKLHIQTSPYTVRDLVEYILYFEAQDLLTKALGVGNPYIEQSLSFMKKPPFSSKKMTF